MTDYHDAAAASRAPLDWMNVLLADVQGGVGPFLAVFLTSSRHWDAGAAGVALTVGGIATVLARAPAGELVDVLRAKRTLIALASAVVAVTCGNPRRCVNRSAGRPPVAWTSRSARSVTRRVRRANRGALSDKGLTKVFPGAARIAASPSGLPEPERDR